MARLDWRDEALDRRVAEGMEIEFCRDMMKLELSEAERAALKLRVPEIAFETAVEIDLGDVTCQAIHVGGDHASDSVVVNVLEDKVVFASDCFYPSIYGGPRFYRPAAINCMMERLLDLGGTHHLAGHHEAPLSRDELAAEAALLRRVGDAVTHFSGDRAAVVESLQASGAPLSPDDVELVDCFVAGLQDPY